MPRFTRPLSIVAAALLVSLPPLASLASASLPPATLPEGVAAGETSANSTLLWARSSVAGNLTFDISADPTFSSFTTQSVNVTDVSVPAKVSFTGLSPNTRYYYRATNAASDSYAGTLKTFAPAGTYAGLNFGVTGDWRGENAPYPAIKNAGSKNLDFFLALGDTIYGDVSSKANAGQQQAQTVAEYRNKYQEVYGTTNGNNSFADLRSSTSTFAIIDDHEVTNDFAGYNTVANDARFTFSNTGTAVDPATRLNKTDLYNNGLQAFQEYHPLAPKTYSVSGADADRFNGVANLYRTQRFGNDAQLFVTDLRSFRDTELADPNPASAASLGGFIYNSLNQTSRTLFGKTQLNQLKSDLLAANNNGVTWKLIEVGEVFQNLGPVGAGDRAEGYSAERNDLLKFIDDNKINNVVFISADIHGSFINGLECQIQGAPTASNPTGLIHKQTNAIEVSTGSVAYSDPAGPTLINLAHTAGLLDDATYNFYNSPTTPDFVREVILQGLLKAQTDAFGYNPIGLFDDAAAGRIRLLAASRTDVPPNYASLLPPSIAAGVPNTPFTNTTAFQWTQFQIDPLTQNLTIDLYGIPAYRPDGLPNYDTTNPVLTNHIVLGAVPEPTSLSLLPTAAILVARRRRA
jgi:phosphodiesterase/alkaline phosphatase D-like protein